MKQFKRFSVFFLSIIMIVLSMSVSFAAVNYNVGDIIEFGTYPQTLVTDESLISNLNSVTKAWKSYGYSTGSYDMDNNATWPYFSDGLMHPSNYMRYSDFFFSGKKYRAVVFDLYRPNEIGFKATDNPRSTQYQTTNNYYCNNVYYFLYEPLKWRILDPNSKLVMCESIVDSQPFHNVIYNDWTSSTEYFQDLYSSRYANNYESSSLRRWLNNDFYETAFSSAQKNIIQTTILNNDAYDVAYSQFGSPVTSDKLFLLSWSDVTNSSLGFNASGNHSSDTRNAFGTDYAKCQGLYAFTNEDGPLSMAYQKSSWLLRTAGSNSYLICGVDAFGVVKSSYSTEITRYGIRPACILSSLNSNTDLSEQLYSETTSISDNQCGDEVFWSLNEANGVLDIYGSGNMWNFDGADSPNRNWFNPSVDIQSIIIHEGVESIGNFAFADHRSLRHVSIPDSLTRIGSEAFASCYSLSSEKALETITIPEGVKSIGQYAFGGCDDLEEIVILSRDCVFEQDAEGTIPEHTVINGYRNSTAEAYATEYTRTFIALDGHTHTPTTYTLPSTCTVPGYTLTTCSECHEQLEFQTLPLAAHQYGEWVIVKPATETETGLRQRTCTVCGGAKQEEEIARLNTVTAEDPATGIQVTYEKDSYNNQTIEVVVEEDFTGSQYLVQTYDKTLAWNIKTYVNGEEAQPGQPVTVRIPLPEGYDSDNIAVFHVNSKTNQSERIEDVRVEDGYIVFTATSFSVYIVVDESTAKDPNTCPWCGKVHSGFFGGIVAFFHRIFARLFGAKY